MNSTIKSLNTGIENLTPSQQTLQDFRYYSGPFIGGFSAVGNIPGVLVFSGINVGAELLDTVLFSDSKTIDYTKTGVKLLDRTPFPYDLFSKELLDQGFDYYKQTDQSSCLQ
jgi:hypothetical protein